MIRRLKHLLIPVYQQLSTAVGRGVSGRSGTSPTAFVLLTPDYGNAGDLAIGVAQIEYLRRLLPGHRIVSVPLSETYARLRAIRAGARDGDLVLLVGGGSTGDLYPRAHFGRIFVVRYLRRLPIVSFPQSVIYSSDHALRVFGRREAAAFASHPRLHLFARERTSLGLMTRLFPEPIGFAPDIVLSMRGLEDVGVERSTALLVLRGDAERSLSHAAHRAIDTAVAALGGPIVRQDHAIEVTRADVAEPDRVVRGILAEYRRARVVITDRLHGMIFAAVTGTPCVVLANTNHKIRGTYDDWVRERCPNVRFVDAPDAESLGAAIGEAIRTAVAADVASPPHLDFAALDAAVLAAAGLAHAEPMIADA